MITNIWLKSQPNKKLSYPDCHPFMPTKNRICVWDNTIGDAIAEFTTESIVRLEFRP